MEARFGCSSPHSVGVEEEFQILDGQNLGLAPRADDILRALGTPAAGEHVQRELYQSVVETSTGIARCVAEAVDELSDLRGRLRDIAAEQGALIAAAGAHPFSLPEDQQVTDRPRYAGIRESMRWVTERGIVSGLHVHVGVDSAEKAIACANGLRLHLPEFLALSANSPFWGGRATGLASARAKIFEGFPRSGIPPAFASFEEFERLVERGVRTGSFPDYTYLWWDVRPHPRIGTVELRICDAQTRLSNVAVVVALAQSLVATLGDRFERGERPRPEPDLFLEENKWQATRDGLDARLIDLASDSRVAARDAVLALAEQCRPKAKELGCDRELDGIDALLERGGGADEQRRLYAHTGSLLTVARWLADETVSG
jgi:carboxylate-amine ligase